jgi:hypothetical protein
LILLEVGADPNIRDDDWSPLMRAGLATTPAAIDAPLAAGANAQVRNRGGDTAADLVRKRLDSLRSIQASESAKGRKRMATLEHTLAILSAAAATR